MYGWRAKIGLLIPSTNTTMEMDFHKLAPEGISVHTERLLFSGKASFESMEEQLRDLERGAASVASAKVDLIVYGVNAATFYKGLGWDKEVAQIIEKKTSIPAITTSTAMIEGLREMNVKKVCSISAYPEEVEKMLLTFIAGNGFPVVKSSNFKTKDAFEVAQIPSYLIYRKVRDSIVPDMDGVFIAVAALNCLEIIDQLEKDFGKPVVAASQASMWYALRKLRLPDCINGFGELLRRTQKVS